MLKRLCFTCDSLICYRLLNGKHCIYIYIRKLLQPLAVWINTKFTLVSVFFSPAWSFTVWNRVLSVTTSWHKLEKVSCLHPVYNIIYTQFNPFFTQISLQSIFSLSWSNIVTCLCHYLMIFTFTCSNIMCLNIMWLNIMWLIAMWLTIMTCDKLSSFLVESRLLIYLAIVLVVSYYLVSYMNDLWYWTTAMLYDIVS